MGMHSIKKWLQAVGVLAVLGGPAAAHAQGLPDFTAEITAVSPDPMSVGDMVTVDVTVREATGQFTGNVTVTAGLVAQPLTTQSIFVQSGLGSGQVTFELRVVGNPAGLVDVLVTADGTMAIVESNENNNEAFQRVTLLGSDLRASVFDFPSVIYPGRPARVTAVVSNDGPADAPAFRLVIDVDRVAVLTTTVAGIAAATQRTLTWRVDIPAGLELGDTQVRLLLDVSLVVPETNENNNIRLRSATASSPAADLVPEIETVPMTVEAGQVVFIGRTVRNIGVDPAPAADHAYIIGDLGPSAPIQLLAFRAAVPVGGDAFGEDAVRIPAEGFDGTQRLRLVADVNDVVPELDEVNNTDDVRIEVLPAPVRVVPDDLPMGQVGRPYDLRFSARGPLAPEFMVAQGRLPAGVTLTADGVMAGTPTEGGRFDFRLRVDAGATVEVDRTLVVSQIAGSRVGLPPAFVGQRYSVQLGDGLWGPGQPYVPPLRFTAIDLPTGFTLSESGLLEGDPIQPSVFRLVIRVSSESGAVTRELDLTVIDGDSGPRIVPQALREAQVGREYCEGGPVFLSADGGNGQLVWSTLDPLAPGMSLSEDGALCGAPQQTGTFDFVVRVQDQQQLFDTERLTLVVTNSMFSLIPEEMPSGLLGAAYEVQLAVNGPGGPFTFALSSGRLPTGLSLSGTGLISGMPSETGLFAFAVGVIDASGTPILVPRSIEIRGPSGLGELETAGSGCRCVGDRPRGALVSMLAVLGLGLLLFGRRRRIERA